MSKKDSYWFRHDSTAGRGLKMRKMAHIYGHWGKGVYWDVVEILRDQDEYKFESDESSLQLLSDLIGCKDETKFINWFNDCLKIGLLSVSNGFFICPPLSDNMEVWETKKNNGSKGGRPRKQRPKTESITELITETKTELKANQNHNRTEQNITLYSKREFLNDWNELRKKYLKKPSNVNRLNYDSEKELKEIIQHYSKEQIQNALIGLFKQKKLPNGNTVMQSNPTHFLKHFESYLAAYEDRNEELYGKKPEVA